METVAKHQQEWLIIHELVRRYPTVFHLDAVKIRPLLKGIYEDLLSDLAIPPDSPESRMLRFALSAYRSRRSYMFAVAAGLRKVNLQGAITEQVSLRERDSARHRLRQMGIWKESHEKTYQSCRAGLESSLRFKSENSGVEQD